MNTPSRRYLSVWLRRLATEQELRARALLARRAHERALDWWEKSDAILVTASGWWGYTMYGIERVGLARRDTAMLGPAQLVWLQEEPENMGPWNFVKGRLYERFDDSHKIQRVSRFESGSPAGGSHAIHAQEQAQLLAAALTA